MSIREQRIAILKQIESGELTLEEGSRRLSGLENGQQPDAPKATGQPAPEATPPAAAAVWPTEPAARAEPYEPVVDIHEDRPARRQNFWWLVVLVPGVLLTVQASYWMYLGWKAAGPGWGYWLSFLPLLLGLALILLGWYLREAPWMHLRIRQNENGRERVIAFSLPVPLGLASWALRVAKPWLPAEVRDYHLEEVLAGISREITPDMPLEIQVDDDGGQVEVYLG